MKSLIDRLPDLFTCAQNDLLIRTHNTIEANNLNSAIHTYLERIIKGQHQTRIAYRRDVSNIIQPSISHGAICPTQLPRQHVPRRHIPQHQSAHSVLENLDQLLKLTAKIGEDLDLFHQDTTEYISTLAYENSQQSPNCIVQFSIMDSTKFYRINCQRSIVSMT